MNETPAALCDKIGYQFTDTALLEQALTHRSAGPGNYERLEFLGDGLLNFLIADALYQHVPAASEGDLTRFRASLVRSATLAELAQEIGIGGCLRLGQGELGSGGFRRRSILADALESLVGAIYLDGGYEEARGVVRRLFEKRLTNLPDAESLKDAKTRLQETLQARGIELPQYELLASEGKDHERVFTMACRVPVLSIETQASASSRRKAEQAAAASALTLIADV